MMLFILVTILLLSVGFVKTHGYKLMRLMNWVNSRFITDNQEFHEIDYEWRPRLRENYRQIRQEYAEYCNNYTVARFGDLDHIQKDYDKGKEKWLVIILKEFGTYTKNIDYFPDTFNLVKDIPGCIMVMFSAIEPNKCILPHNGPYNGVLRYHLALFTDPFDPDNCYIIVGKYKYVWRAGEDMIFDDMFLHFAQNNTQTTRVVLILDILRDFDNVFISFLNRAFVRISDYNQTKREIINRVNSIIEVKK